MNLRTSRIISAVTVGLMVVGCTPAARVTIDRLAPPLVDVSGIKDVAVLPFADRTPDGNLGALAGDRLVSVLVSTGRYRVMKTEEMQRLLDKAGIHFFYPPDPATVREIGSVLKSDALLYGEVQKFQVKEESDLITVREPVWTGEYVRDRKGTVVSDVDEEGRVIPRKRYEKRLVEKNRLRRYAVLDIHYRMADSFHGNAILAETESESGSWEATGEAQIAQLPGREAIFDLLVDRTTKNFVRNIAPHPIEEERILEFGTFHATGLGVELAKNGLWNEAAEKWIQATKAKPGESAAYYNLGVAFERRGAFDLAHKAYQNALVRHPHSKRYVEAVTHIQKLMQGLQ
jgi:hypothetical protein